MTALARLNLVLMGTLIAHTVDHAVNQPAREVPASAGVIGVAGFAIIGASAVLAIRRSPAAPAAALLAGAATALGVVAVHLLPSWWDLVSDPYWDFGANALSWALALAPLLAGVVLATAGAQALRPAVGGGGDKLALAMFATATTSAATARELTDVELAAWRGFLRAHAHLVRELDAGLRDAHNLPLSAYDVLVRLASAPDRRLRMSELADCVVLTPSGLTRLVDRLCRDGLVERVRCPSDARGSFAVLTDDGAARFAEARATHLEGVRRLFLSHFSAAELRRLGEQWERLLPGDDLRTAGADA